MPVQGKSYRYRVALTHLFFISFIAIVIFPLLMIVSISFREGNFAIGSIFPENFSLEHWKKAFGMVVTEPDGTISNPPYPVLLWLWNSIKIALTSSFLILLLSTSCAYGFARFQFFMKKHVLNGLLILQMFPAVMFLVAIYAILETIGTYIPWLGLDTQPGLILVHLGGVALHIWTIKGYFETIPASMEESAQIDGASPFQAFIHILLPLSVPILMVIFLLAFIGIINEYPVSSIVTSSEEILPLSVGMTFYLQAQNFLWGDFAAAAVLSGIPITVLFIIGQRWLVSGLTSGGVKG